MSNWNYSLIQGAMPYTIEDLARLPNKSEPSIRKKLKSCPDAVASGSPSIVVGRLFKDFLATEKPRRKKSKIDAKMQCFACKSKVSPAGQMVEARPQQIGKTALLSAICDQCEGPINKIISVKDRAKFEVALGEATTGEWGP